MPLEFMHRKPRRCATWTKTLSTIGKSVVFKGELSGSEDLVIEGTVEGKIELRDHVLTVGAHAKIKAEVFAKIVIVLGEVVGNITASEKLDIRDSGSVDGDIVSPRVAIAEGAHLARQRGHAEEAGRGRGARPGRKARGEARAPSGRHAGAWQPAYRGRVAPAYARGPARHASRPRPIGWRGVLVGRRRGADVCVVCSHAWDPSGRRKEHGLTPALPPRPEDGTIVTSKALQKFLSYLGTRPAPILLDLGPIVGSNVTFFGEQLNCKFVVEDLFADLERHVRDGPPEEFPAFLSKRFRLEEGTVDGVLLWDLYDYLDRPSAQALATTLVRLMRADGALLGFFGNASHVGSGCTKFIVLDDSHVRQRAHASALVRQGSLQNRDIIKMFDGLRVSDAFQLKTGRREMLFRAAALALLLLGESIGGIRYPDWSLLSLSPLFWLGIGLAVTRHVLWPQPSWFATAVSFVRAFLDQPTTSANMARRADEPAGGAAGRRSCRDNRRPVSLAVPIPRVDERHREPAGQVRCRLVHFDRPQGLRLERTLRGHRNAFAFLPAFPAAMRVAGDLLTLPAKVTRNPEFLGGGNARVLWGAVLVSMLCFGLALQNVRSLCALDGASAAEQTRAAVIVAAYPFALYFSAPYTEE